jgi:hypothetical protein
VTKQYAHADVILGEKKTCLGADADRLNQSDKFDPFSAIGRRRSDCSWEAPRLVGRDWLGLGRRLLVQRM